MQSLEELARKMFKGKKIKSLEFHEGNGDEEKERLHKGKVIKELHVGMSEGREDAGLWLTLEDNTRIFVYENEGIEVED